MLCASRKIKNTKTITINTKNTNNFFYLKKTKKKKGAIIFGSNIIVNRVGPVRSGPVQSSNLSSCVTRI